MLITAPSDTERVVRLAVNIVRAELRDKYVRVALDPWVRIYANSDTDEIKMACGLGAKRLPKEKDDAA